MLLSDAFIGAIIAILPRTSCCSLPTPQGGWNAVLTASGRSRLLSAFPATTVSKHSYYFVYTTFAF